jgi:putative membrane protein
MFQYKTVTLAALIAAGMTVAGYSPAYAASDAKSDKLSSGDKSFIKDAATGGMMEVELGKLAAEKAGSDKVKAFGRQMQDDHSKANDELKNLAKDKGVELPTSLGVKQKLTVERLSKLSGEDFDRQYMKTMIDDHKTDVSHFEKEASKAKDPDVKAFASKTLPTLKKHLQMAETTGKEVRATTAKK